MTQPKVLIYETRDGKGNDITREIAIKPQKVIPADGPCAVCGAEMTEGVAIKSAVSSNFTDWAFFSETQPVVCPKCAQLFSIFPYSYTYEPESGRIRLLNVRQIKDALLGTGELQGPFLFTISVSQKKHLFYRCVMNSSPPADDQPFAVNLETETIYTTREHARLLFDLVENLSAAGTPKTAAAEGVINNATAELIGMDEYRALEETLEFERTRSGRRDILIALHAAQKPDTEPEIAAQRLIEAREALDAWRQRNGGGTTI